MNTNYIPGTYFNTETLSFADLLIKPAFWQVMKFPLILLLITIIVFIIVIRIKIESRR